MSTESALLHRWSSELEEYAFAIKHRSGKLQVHVDCLSQLPTRQSQPEYLESLVTNASEKDRCRKGLASLAGQEMTMQATEMKRPALATTPTQNPALPTSGKKPPTLCRSLLTIPKAGILLGIWAYH
ncbi:hypothetical protein E2C01_041266 [Portunus trituberculatus]|uniref:Uncharacterized protein n=1 Tax=Portunus trituberculatus TaxID=210409 RepID=A0A5B7FQ87_PORTR|nr:hypothetical protein [Portunus trituberculatus]